MINWILEKIAHYRGWKPLSEISSGYFAPEPSAALVGKDEALTISAVWAALRLFQTTIGSLPLVTYSRSTRKRLRDHQAYPILHDRPNPAMSRYVFMARLVKAMFLDGDFYCFIKRNRAGELLGLYPIHCSQVEEVLVDDEMAKVYKIGREMYDDSEIIHLFNHSEDGIQGTSFIKYASENLGLHKQVQVAASAYYKNSARPANYIRFPGKLTEAAKEEIKRGFAAFEGARNTGKTPWLENGADLVPFSKFSAAEAQILEALGNVADVARWFGVSPLLLADLSRGTYANVSSDNIAFYQRSIRPLLEQITLELNHKLFHDGDVFCDFVLTDILKGDPLSQAQSYQIGINSGYILRSEVREFENLVELAPEYGMDKPVGLLNLGNLTPDNNAHQNPNPDTNTPQPQA